MDRAARRGGVPLTGPTLTSVDPTSGPEAGGKTVVLTGTGLATGSSVRFGIVASDFVVDSDTRITAIAVPGPVDITVITAGGTPSIPSRPRSLRRAHRRRVRRRPRRGRSRLAIG
ncbi:IPT/TIG domain-containing protein [Nocardia sp. NPDC005745]|uniref:IPT/TIG domain-containing protein n=1 Tax=Nocardia sp. NPDC005745 TaxID=3157061 RepID=UPI0033EF483C